MRKDGLFSKYEDTHLFTFTTTPQTRTYAILHSVISHVSRTSTPVSKHYTMNNAVFSEM